MVTYVKLNSSK